MNVLWYYAVGGKRTGPVTWTELKHAVEAGAVGADDLVWSASFGNEWRAAGTLEGLFPPPKTEPEIADEKPADDTPPAPPPLVDLKSISPFYVYDITNGASADRHRGRVRCFDLLKKAWRQTVLMFQSQTVLRRWLAFTLCVLLIGIGRTTSPLLVFAQAGSVAETQRLDEYGLSPLFSSGVFALDKNEKFMLLYRSVARNDAPDMQEAQTMLVAEFGAAMHVTAVEFARWLNAGNNQNLLLGLILFTVLASAIYLWFAARGNIMLFVRLYRPDDPMIVTWIETDRFSGRVFKGLFFASLMLTALTLAYSSWGLKTLVAIPLGTHIDAMQVVRLLSGWFALLLLNTLVTGFIKDFVIPRIVLHDISFAAALAAALRALGFWYARYVALYAALFSVLILLLRNLIAVLPATLFLPVTGALLMMPFYVIQRLWSLNIVFAQNPELRRAVPKYIRPAYFRRTDNEHE